MPKWFWLLLFIAFVALGARVWFFSDKPEVEKKTEETRPRKPFKESKPDVPSPIVGGENLPTGSPLEQGNVRRRERPSTPPKKNSWEKQKAPNGGEFGTPDFEPPPMPEAPKNTYEPDFDPDGGVPPPPTPSVEGDFEPVPFDSDDELPPPPSPVPDTAPPDFAPEPEPDFEEET